MDTSAVVSTKIFSLRHFIMQPNFRIFKTMEEIQSLKDSSLHKDLK